MASPFRGARDPRPPSRGADGDVVRARGPPLGEAVRRVPRRNLGLGDARPAEPGAPGVARAALSARTRDAVPGRGGARGHLLGLRAGAQDPARLGRVGLAERVAAARGGPALILPRVDGPSPIGGRPVLTTASNEQERYESAKGNAVDTVVWRIEHGVLDRETRAVAESSGTTEAEGERPRFHELYGGTVAVSTRDPAIASADSRASLTIEWPEATVTSKVHQVVRSDAEAYHLTIDLDLSENGTHRWSRRWERRIARRLQ